ncbi:unnamed protein product, partial [Effrenium voratum]
AKLWLIFWTKLQITLIHWHHCLSVALLRLKLNNNILHFWINCNSKLLQFLSRTPDPAMCSGKMLQSEPESKMNLSSE